MRGKYVYIIIISLLLLGCIEPYDFVIEDDTNGVVIESILTDKSYNDTKNYPSDGRYFKVKISRTSEVNNVLNDPILGANVYLLTSENDSVYYNEVGDGVYEIRDAEFKARCGIMYQLHVELADETNIESSWSKLPTEVEQCGIQLGNVSLEEDVQKRMVVISGEEKLKEVKGLSVVIDLPVISSPKYYVWNFESMWVYESILNPIVNKRCWVRNNLNSAYLGNYVLHKDLNGGYDYKLLFLELNDMFVHEYSIMTTQYSVDENYYGFLNDIQQRNSNDLIGTTPYNLKSNYVSNTDISVYGYFSVANESANRRYFDRSQLSYFLDDYGAAACRMDEFPSVSCYDCLEYPKGIPSLNPPSWWH